jgi:hypothetical protein
VAVTDDDQVPVPAALTAATRNHRGVSLVRPPMVADVVVLTTSVAVTGLVKAASVAYWMR